MSDRDQTTAKPHGPSGRAARAVGRRQAFTLVELVVVVIIVGLLSAIAAVGYAQFANGARDTKAKEQLRSLTAMAMAFGAENDIVENLTYEMFVGALQSFPDVVTPGVSAAGAGWSVVPGSQPPVDDHQFSVAFDNGIGTSMSTVDGTRAAVVTRSGTGRYWGQLMLAAPIGSAATPGMFPVPDGATAADVLGGAVEEGADLPYPATSPTPAPTTAAPTPVPTGETSSPSSTPASSTPASSTPTSEAPTWTPTPTPTPTPVSDSPTPTRDPVTDPVTVTPRPNINWLTCSPGTGTPNATVSKAQIATHGDSAVWWSMNGTTEHVLGYKICSRDNQGNFAILASTGPGTGDARTWLVRTNSAHPNIDMYVVTVFDDGREANSTNRCEVQPAGYAKGWDKTCAGN